MVDLVQTPPPSAAAAGRATAHDEAGRLAALRAFAVLDTPPEPAFDDLARLASMVCETPIALVSLIDEDRQWFKARVGIDVCETGRGVAFCGHAIEHPGVFVVEDAHLDPRFRDNPLVSGPPYILFYAGAPLVTPSGHSVGTLCVIDSRARTLTPEQQFGLEALARQVTGQLVRRTQFQQLQAAHAATRVAERRFRAFMDNGPAVAFIKDPDGKFVYVNDPLCRRFERPEAEWLGKTDAEIWSADDAAAFRRVDRAVTEGGVTVKTLEYATEPDGRRTTWQSYKFPFPDALGRVCLAGLALDATADAAAAEALRASEQKFRSTVERLAEGVYLVDNATGRITDANTAFLTLVGYTAAEVRALTPADLTVAGEPASARSAAAPADAGRGDLGVRRYRRKDGAVVDVDVRTAAVPDGGAGHTSVIVRDVTEDRRADRRVSKYQQELEAANARLSRQARTDPLTGVANRAALHDELAAEFARVGRTGRPMSVLLADVDHFKSFNDTFGHPAGDVALQAVAELLVRAVRGADLVARYGGEEFAVVLPDTDEAGATASADRVRRAIADASWPVRPVTVSVGAATSTAATPGWSALLGEADAALYRAKRAGRNQAQHGSGFHRLPVVRAE